MRRFFSAPCRLLCVSIEARLAALELENSKLQQQVHMMNQQMQEIKLKDTLEEYCHKPETRLSLDAIVYHCKQEHYSTARFIMREVPIRLASHVKELGELPHGLSMMPSVRKARQQYIDSFAEFVQFKASKPFKNPYRPTREEQEPLMGVVRNVQDRHRSCMQLLAKGVHEFKETLHKATAKDRDEKTETSQEVMILDYPDVQTALDNFYSHRIGTHFLMSQHVAVHNDIKRPTFVGIIDTQMPLAELIQEAASHSKAICTSVYGGSPIVNIRSSPSSELVIEHIPTHVRYILIELLKNSMRAVIENSKKQGITIMSQMPPIEVTFSAGKGYEDACLRVTDSGGGIARSQLKYVWSYLYTTANAFFDLSVEDGKLPLPTTMAGFGYGLPLSRLYARYFGGDLRLMSLEGHGCDAFLHLRLGREQDPNAIVPQDHLIM
eukprot:TRINITY_DN48820_c0_g1_i1.p1 TRINITY_DN48820_c0_g1~~TRINITY_DN48820_c0_g1_i1.p1  ORF type:complete len:437 (-),score=19.66 TRINITY_DN48820_c0_g1_i1:95-1405(-)